MNISTAESELKTLRSKLKHSKHHIRLLVSDDQFSTYFESRKAFDDAVDNFFNLDDEEMVALHYLGYPLRGALFFDHQLLTRVNQLLPEFLLSLLAIGNSILFTIYQYQTGVAHQDVEINTKNIRNISENVFYIWKQIGEIETSELVEKEKLAQLAKLGSVLNFDKVRYDFLSCFQMNVISQQFYLSLRGVPIIDEYGLILFDDGNKRRLLEEIVGYLAMPLVFAEEDLKGEGDFNSVMEDLARRVREAGFITNVNSALNQSIGYPSIADTVTSTIQLRSSEHVFQRIGDVWNIKYESEQTQLNNLVGLYYIHQLLISPQEYISSDVLVSPAEHSMNKPSGLIINKEEINQDREIPQDISNQIASSASEIRETQSAYKSGIDALRDELQKIDKESPLYKSKLDELVQLRKSYSSSYSIRGVERPQSSSEQARQSVRKAIKHVLDRLERETPSLSNHLSLYITTGFECTYNPPDDELISWLL